MIRASALAVIACLLGGPSAADTLTRHTVTGSVVNPAFAGYDAVTRRFVAFVDKQPAFLSVTTDSWTIVGPPYNQSASNAGFGNFYDPATNVLGTYSVDSLFTIHPGVDASWSSIATTGSKPGLVPGPMFPGTNFRDISRHRVLTFGVRTYGSLAQISHALYAFDYQTATWSILLPSTPLGYRETEPFLDSKRGRLLFFGGASQHNLFPPDALGDLWSMDLATLAFAMPAAQGTPPTARYYFPTGYDPLRDRGIVFGGIQLNAPQRGVYYLDFKFNDPAGKWLTNDPSGEPVPDNPGTNSAFDAIHDRFYVPSADSYYELAFDPVPLLVACPPPTVWVTGGSVPLTFHVTRVDGTSQLFGWSVTSPRSWPGFPLNGSSTLSDTAAVVVVNVPVPDTASVGAVVLTFTISGPPGSDSCKVTIGDAGTPAPWALVHALLRDGRARLMWWTSERGEADIERREARGAWECRGTTQVSGDGYVRYEDDSVEPGARYAFRAGIAGAWSEETWVDVPAAALAFARGGLVSNGALAVSFTLPGTGPAQLEAFDVAGRRVARREISGSGEHVIELAPAGALRRGVYFLRLSQDGVRVTARAVVLGER